MTILHVAPHADDECIGAPATLMALRDAGGPVVNLACSLGRPAERGRRLAELEAACAAARFTLEVAADAVGDSLGDPDAARIQLALEEVVADAVERHRPPVVVGPSPHDRHRGHEIVGRALVEVCARAAAAGRDVPRLWLWGLWADLPFPTLIAGFDEARMKEVLAALECHAGELARNDYRRVVRGRAAATATLGPERVFGFGSAGAGVPYAEVLCELVRRGPRWQLGAPRWLDPHDPLGTGAGTAEASGPDVTDWLEAPSLTARYGPPGHRRPGGPDR